MKPVRIILNTSLLSRGFLWSGHLLKYLIKMNHYYSQTFDPFKIVTLTAITLKAFNLFPLPSHFSYWEIPVGTMIFFLYTGVFAMIVIKNLTLCKWDLNNYCFLVALFWHSFLGSFSYGDVSPFTVPCHANFTHPHSSKK